jgi:hypothetical protein
LSLLISQGYPEISQWYVSHCDEIRVNGRKSSDGKSGLEVLMLLIERGLNPSMDESQRILSGPLIADLVQKVPYSLSFDSCCHPYLLFVCMVLICLGKRRDSTSSPNALERDNNPPLHRHKTRIHPGPSPLLLPFVPLKPILTIIVLDPSLRNASDSP